MFLPVYSLSKYSEENRQTYTERWKEPGLNEEVCYEILKQLEKGYINLNSIELLEGLEYGFLENESDIKGIDIKDKELLFTESKYIKNFDFSYAILERCTFQNISFSNCKFNFSILKRTKFINCTFKSVNFFGCYFKNTDFSDCDFVINCWFTNCDIRNMQFQKCFLRSDTFINCKFNDKTNFIDIPCKKLNNSGETADKIDNRGIVKILYGITEGFRNGDATYKYRQYLYQKKTYERKTDLREYTQKDKKFKKELSNIWFNIYNYILEITSGYGLKPHRVLITTIIVFALFTFMWGCILRVPNSLLFSSGAFFTFGALNDTIKEYPLGIKLFYVFESFSGIFLMATFITVLSNYLFKQK